MGQSHTTSCICVQLSQNWELPLYHVPTGNCDNITFLLFFFFLKLPSLREYRVTVDVAAAIAQVYLLIHIDILQKQI